jgi:hypothetical protein
MPEVIKERTIEQGPDGAFYSLDAVTLLYKDFDGFDITFYCPPDSLYDTVLSGIRKMAQLESEPDTGLTPDLALLKKQLAKVVKASVKGLLMLWGDKLLTLFYGTTDHPHLPKKHSNLDLVDWYMAEFTKVLIANMMRKDLVLEGQRVRTMNGQTVISISKVDTRPISGATSVIDSTPGETHKG